MLDNEISDFQYMYTKFIDQVYIFPRNLSNANLN